jgi:hypothetical protein
MQWRLIHFLPAFQPEQPVPRPGAWPQGGTAKYRHHLRKSGSGALLLASRPSMIFPPPNDFHPMTVPSAKMGVGRVAIPLIFL